MGFANEADIPTAGARLMGHATVRVTQLMGHATVRVTQDLYISADGDLFERFSVATE